MPRSTRHRDETPACPVCGYDQSGFISSWRDTCPLAGSCSECGAHIEWREVFRPDLYAQRSYAEHPDARMPRDAFRSARRAFRPGSLWRWIPRSQPLALRRLLLSGAIGAAVMAVVVPAILIGATIGGLYAAYAQRSPHQTGLPSGLPVVNLPSGAVSNAVVYQLIYRSYQKPLPYIEDYFRNEADFGESAFPIIFLFHISGVVVAAFWALLARHRGVQLHHILRFAVFTSIPLLLLANIDLARHCFAALFWYDPQGFFAWMEPIHDNLEIVFLATLAIAALWLWRAWVLFLTRYLRARRPLLTVVVYGIVALLLLPAVLVGLPTILEWTTLLDP